MPSDLPNWLQIPVLLVVGLAIGVFVNWAIYSWAMFLKRPISPWMTPPVEATPRLWTDRIPIFGWPARRRDTELFGAHFWVRPMLIELACLLGVPIFYLWLVDGGLTSQAAQGGDWESICGVWFYAYGVLLVLMCIGTFIDFDEKTIFYFVECITPFPYKNRHVVGQKTLVKMTFWPLCTRLCIF